jgi:hypothetical protein
MTIAPSLQEFFNKIDPRRPVVTFGEKPDNSMRCIYIGRPSGWFFPFGFSSELL